MKFGFTDTQWHLAVAEATHILTQRATQRQTISYSDLARELRSITIGYHDYAMDGLLGDVSTSEFESGRPLLSVIVVRKYGEQDPGNGFFLLAQALGFDTSDRDSFWICELNRTFDHWSQVHQVA